MTIAPSLPTRSSRWQTSPLNSPRPPDRIQQVIEVVCDAPSQRADALQPLRAQESGLQFFPGSDVGVDSKLGLGAALVITQEDPTSFDDDLPSVPGNLAQLTAPFSL